MSTNSSGWMSNPASLNAINLATAYTLIQKRTPPKILPLPVAYSLICAVLTSLLPARPRPLPPPLTMTPLFVDAALLTSTLGSSTTLYQVASVKPRAFATATSAPAWVRDQQTAELYSVSTPCARVSNGVSLTSAS